MAPFVATDRVRAITLNAGMLAIFACSWIADKWPHLLGPALFGTAIFVCAQVGLLFLFACSTVADEGADRAASNFDASPSSSRALAFHGLGHSDEPVLTDKDLDAALVRARAAIIANSEARARLVAMSELVESMALFEFKRPTHGTGAATRRAAAATSFVYTRYVTPMRARASRPETWAFASATPDCAPGVSLSTILGSALPELDDWVVSGGSPGVFDIAAGPIKIEHFHGHITVRVLDPSHVVVAGARAPRHISDFSDDPGDIFEAEAVPGNC